VLTEAQGYALVKSAVELGIGYVGGSIAEQLRRQIADRNNAPK
jgi:hypothetical protein